MTRRSWTLLSVIVLLPGLTLAGPDWVEETDAGGFPGTSQAPKGVGPISTIAGTLAAALTIAGGDDMEDMYRIYISNPSGFSAQTILGGSAEFDSQLWLLDVNGRAVLANDDATMGLSGSRVAPPANDGTGHTIPGPGVYYLAITGFNNDPTNAFYQSLFNQATRIEISGPDGPGGSFSIAAWGISREAGSYLIKLSGAEFPPGDCDEDGIFDPNDDDIDGDDILNDDDSCDYTPLNAASLVIIDSKHPLYGSLACDIDGDCDCDLNDFAEFERLFSGVGCADGEAVTNSTCPVIPPPPTAISQP